MPLLYKKFSTAFSPGDTQQRDPPARAGRQAWPGQRAEVPVRSLHTWPRRRPRSTAPLTPGCPGKDAARRCPLTTAAARATHLPLRARPAPQPGATVGVAARSPAGAGPSLPGAAKGKRRREDKKRRKSRRSRRYRRPCPQPARRQRCGIENGALTWSLPPRPAGREEEAEAMLQRSQAPLLTSPSAGAEPSRAHPHRRAGLPFAATAPSGGAEPLRCLSSCGRQGRGGLARIPSLATSSGGCRCPAPSLGSGARPGDCGPRRQGQPGAAGAHELPHRGALPWGERGEVSPARKPEGDSYQRARKGQGAPAPRRAPPSAAAPPAPAPRLTWERRSAAASASPEGKSSSCCSFLPADRSRGCGLGSPAEVC